MFNLAHFNLTEWVLTMLVLVIAITIHEFAHALAADRLGDSTPRAQGRISLNPVDHLDPLGTVFMAVSTATGFGIGWGRPVQYNPQNLKDGRWGSLLIAVCGPISNLLQAVVFAGILRLNEGHGWLDPNSAGYHVLEIGVFVNLALALFNLIPIPPLDGSKVLAALLPQSQARRYEIAMGHWGLLLFLVLVFTGATSFLIGPPVSAMFRFLVG